MKLLEISNLRKVYKTRFSREVVALEKIDFSVNKGEFVAIMGESGSGKTTLLNLIGMLDKISAGEIKLNDKPINTISNKEVSKFRLEHLGFVFQDFNLLDNFNVRDNIVLPLVLRKVDLKSIEERLDWVLEYLGISELENQFPYEISGGEKQRVVIARALISEPDLILADEPTGQLDSKNSEKIMNVLSEINDLGQTILMVTHSISAASNANRILFIKDGKIYHQLYRGDMDNNQLYSKISDTLTILKKGGQVNER